MIVIQAKIKCDRYQCEVTADVCLNVSSSKEHDIPKLTIDTYPKDWGYGSSSYDEEHLCPDHVYK